MSEKQGLMNLDRLAAWVTSSQEQARDVLVASAPRIAAAMENFSKALRGER